MRTEPTQRACRWELEPRWRARRRGSTPRRSPQTRISSLGVLLEGELAEVGEFEVVEVGELRPPASPGESALLAEMTEHLVLLEAWVALLPRDLFTDDNCDIAG